LDGEEEAGGVEQLCELVRVRDKWVDWCAYGMGGEEY
jgi:hypothetical protein